MKISPLSQNGMTVAGVSVDAPQTMSQKIRALRMNTNATPGQVDTPPPSMDPKLTIPDNVDPAAAEVTQPLSPQLARLAKDRRALQVKEREIADREKALEARLATQAGGVDLARLKSDPLGVLLDNGVTYDQLTEAVLANQSGVTPQIQALQAEIKALKEGVDKTFSDRDSQQEQQVLGQMEKDARLLIATGDEYELVRETKSVPEVIKLVKRVYDETGDVLDIGEALRLYENELVKDSLKLAALKKVQSQLNPTLPAPPKQMPQQRPRTLTNRDTASVPMSAKARALAAFQGTLKK